MQKGKKHITELESYKFTVDISGENKKALDEVTDNLDKKYGPMVNLLISTFCRMPQKIKNSFLDFCSAKYIELTKLMARAGEVEREELKQERDFYKKIATIINNGNELEILPKTIQIPLKEGYITIPSDWIVLNPEEAGECMYAGIVECRNHERYGIPHFVFFTNIRYACDYSKQYIQQIDEMCTKVWPDFKDVMEKQIELIPDPNHQGRFLNEEAFFSAPIIGHFNMYEQGEIPDPPFGAMIVRDGN